MIAPAEEWRGVEGFPAYEVSDLGHVRRRIAARNAPAGKLLSTRGCRNGYPSVDLCKGGRKRSTAVHRLVARAFLGPCPLRGEVNHRNGDKADNRAGNLEYVTRSENQLHAYRNGLQDARGSKNGAAKLTELDVADIRRMLRIRPRPSFRAIGSQFGVSETAIRHIANGGWSHVPEVAQAELFAASGGGA